MTKQMTFFHPIKTFTRDTIGCVMYKGLQWNIVNDVVGNFPIDVDTIDTDHMALVHKSLDSDGL
jgi:hypothetical protein